LLERSEADQSRRQRIFDLLRHTVSDLEVKIAPAKKDLVVVAFFVS